MDWRWDIVLAFNIWISLYLVGMFGVSLSTLGVLCTLCTALSIDAFGTTHEALLICAKWALLSDKGFAIALAALVGVALMAR